MKLFSDEAKEITKEVKLQPKKNAKITLCVSNYSTEVTERDGSISPKGTEYISVRFSSNNNDAGESSTYLTEIEVQAEVKRLIERYEDFYKITIIDERRLNKVMDSVEPIIEKTKKQRQTRAKHKNIEDYSISDLKFEIMKEKQEIEKLQKQDETGWSELDISLKGKEVNTMLCKAHISYYKGFLDKAREKYNPLLNKWKEFIVNLCKEKGKEVEIWFNESVPFECEVALRLKEHKCYYQCVDFRFDKGKLKAYDFYGTETANSNETEENEIRKVMERVFNNECCSEGCSCEPKIHTIDEKGWLDD